MINLPNKPTYEELQLENDLLKKTVLDLMKRIESLEQELASSKVKKNSKNSGTPPSTDLSRQSKQPPPEEVALKTL